MIRLFTSFYPEQNPERLRELTIALERNCGLPEMDSVCVFLEGIGHPLAESSQLSVRAITSRPKYTDFFGWANELISTDNDVSIIANSDIYFDSTLGVLGNWLRWNQCVALSRWDLQADGSSRLFDRNDSQDAWIFRGKIRPMNADFCVGIPRCDNRILYELRAAGYEVINPAFSVKAYHLHAGERGEYPSKIQGLHVDPPYNYLWPHNLKSLPATLLHNLRHPDSKLGWRIDWRKLQRTLPWRAVDKLKRLAARTERRDSIG